MNNIKRISLLILYSFLLFAFAFKNINAKETLNFLKYQAKIGDNTNSVFKKFKIEYNNINLIKFKELNRIKFSKKNGLLSNITYKLPIVILEQTTDNQEIIKYNNYLTKSKLIIKSKKILTYIPYDYYIKSQNNLEQPTQNNSDFKALQSNDDISSGDYINKNSKNEKDLVLNEQIFGKKYSKVKILDKQLSGRVFYIDPGHGGPDPGAIGDYNGNKISEDEYAYDVSLRLAYFLMQHSAKVYVLVIDKDDGIRDEQFLKLDNDEVYLGDEKIHQKQKERLQQRVNIVNKLYKKNLKKFKSQDLITIHLDSRENEQRIDIFFYYQDTNENSYNFANSLFKSIEDKYEKYQPGRGYQGSVSSRSLFMLNHSKANAIYIELGNIQNKKDQIRFIQKNNRSAIAKWLCDGIIDYYSKTTQNNTKK